MASSLTLFATRTQLCAVSVLRNCANYAVFSTETLALM